MKMLGDTVIKFYFYVAQPCDIGLRDVLDLFLFLVLFICAFALGGGHYV